MTKITVIIPAQSDTEALPILSSLKDVDYPKDKIEILLSIGSNPSVQRNRATKVANGDILYFFNRDSQMTADLFNKVVDIFDKDERIAGVGGPDLTPSNNSYIQHLFGYAMSSYFAHWKMRARYSQLGKERVSDEKELVLSNMAIKRDIYLKANGFNEKLYPNEENDLINRISKMGYRFVYNPDLRIYRDRRQALPTFISQFYRYGKGRMNQIFIEGAFKNLLFFMPVFLLIYLLILPFVKDFWVSFVPLLAYIIFGVIDIIALSLKKKKNLLLILPIIYFSMHISYAIGMVARFCEKVVVRNKKLDYRFRIICIKSLGESENNRAKERLCQ